MGERIDNICNIEKLKTISCNNGKLSEIAFNTAANVCRFPLGECVKVKNLVHLSQNTNMAAPAKSSVK